MHIWQISNSAYYAAISRKIKSKRKWKKWKKREGERERESERERKKEKFLGKREENNS